jgi:hypothetical protein
VSDYRIENFVAAPIGWWAVYFDEDSGEFIYAPIVGWGDCNSEGISFTGPITVDDGGNLTCASDTSNFCEVVFTANAFHRINITVDGVFQYEVPSLPRRTPNTF